MTARPTVPSPWQTLAWRHYEEAQGEALRDPAIEAAAIAAGPDLATRIAARARAFCARESLDEALAAYARHGRQALVIAVVAGTAIGLGTARLIPEAAPARANVMDMLAALLAPNLLALLLWAVLQLAASLRGGGAAGSLLGQTLQQGLERLTRGLRARRDPRARAAQRAWFDYHAGTMAGRARLALLSHAFWLALALGAMLGCWWLLSLRQVDFYWGSTLLGPEAIGRLIEVLARPIAALGLPVPSATDVAASRLDAVANDPALRARWGWFLLGALAVFGVLPRVLALALCGALVRLGDRRYRPDLSQPGFFRLQPLLMPEPMHTRVLDPDEGAGRARPSVAVASLGQPPPAAAWVALERALPAPREALDLGTIVERGDQQRLLATLAQRPAWPALVIHAPLAATPDRGVAQFVASLVAAARCPLWLSIAIEDEDALPAAERAARIEDWRALGEKAGIAPARIVEARA
ncbi:MAG TPA: DUF2868 domain-containing protein [Gammaproteobacteria bacterium]|nr:DUF2868 domain-containing protein [Gammaproteobacteria bacterium]